MRDVECATGKERLLLWNNKSQLNIGTCCECAKLLQACGERARATNVEKWIEYICFITYVEPANRPTYVCRIFCHSKETRADVCIPVWDNLLLWAALSSAGSCSGSIPGNADWHKEENQQQSPHLHFYPTLGRDREKQTFELCVVNTMCLIF